MNNGQMAVCCLISKRKKKPQQATTVKGTHCGTFLPFVAANGDVLAIYFVLSMKFGEKNQKETKLVLPSSFSQTCFGPASPILFFNDSGYVNGEIFHQIMAHFTCVWRE